MKKLIISFICLVVFCLAIYAEKLDALQNAYDKNPNILKFIDDEKDLAALTNTWDFDIAVNLAIKYKNPMLIKIIIDSSDTDSAKDKLLYAIQESNIFKDQTYDTMRIKIMLDRMSVAISTNNQAVSRALSTIPTEILVDSLENNKPLITDKMVEDEIARRYLIRKKKELGDEPALEMVDGVIVNKMRNFENNIKSDISNKNYEQVKDKIVPQKDKKDNTGKQK